MEELLVGGPVGVTGSADSDVLKKTQVANLIGCQLVIHLHGGLLGVGPDAADVVRSARAETIMWRVSECVIQRNTL